MIFFEIIGFVLLAILCLILAIILIVLILSCFKTSFVLAYDEQFVFSIKYMFLKIKIYPFKDKNEKKRKNKEDSKSDKDKKADEAVESQKSDESGKKTDKKTDTDSIEEAEEEEDGESEGFFTSILKSLNFHDYIELLRIIFEKFLSKFTIDKLKIAVKIAGDDAAQTAINYGKINSALYPVMGLLHSSGKIKNAEINIYPDFTSTQTKYKAYTEISTRIIYLIFTMIIILIYILKNKKKIK